MLGPSVYLSLMDNTTRGPFVEGGLFISHEKTTKHFSSPLVWRQGIISQFFCLTRRSKIISKPCQQHSLDIPGSVFCHSKSPRQQFSGSFLCLCVDSCSAVEEFHSKREMSNVLNEMDNYDEMCCCKRASRQRVWWMDWTALFVCSSQPKPCLPVKVKWKKKKSPLTLSPSFSDSLCLFHDAALLNLTNWGQNSVIGSKEPKSLCTTTPNT